MMSAEEKRARHAARERKRTQDPAVRAAIRERARKRREDPVLREMDRERVRRRREDPAVKEAERLRAREGDRRRRADPARIALRREIERLKRADPVKREEMLARQRSRCAPPAGHPGTCECCGRAPKERRPGVPDLNQDHRHDNGVIRGWLCVRCNTLVAAFDLEITDPRLYHALKAWSARCAPPGPLPKSKSKIRVPAPRLFASGDR